MDSIIFSVDGNYDLLLDIKKQLMELESVDNITMTGDVNVQKFSDGEVCVDFETSVRGKRVYLLTSPNTAEKILQLNFAIDAAKRAGSREIIPIIPYFPYSRQDKKDQLRGPIGAKVMAEMIENRGATSVITFDLHADQIQGFFNIPVMHMEGKYLFDRYIIDVVREQSNLDKVVLCAPDAGAAKRVKSFRDLIKNRWDVDLPIVMIDKTRKKANEIDSMVIIGEVRAKIVIIIDDMCDTAGTLCKAAEELNNAGALEVRAIVTHGVLSGPAIDRLTYSVLDAFVCSDSLPIRGDFDKGHDDLENTELVVISTAKQIAKGILATEKHTSIEQLKYTE